MVHFVGAGPGAEDLITVRGARLIREADVVIYAGSLVNPKLLDTARADCRIYDSARMTLEDIIEVMKAADARGETVVRLHTGEPSLYGAVREQMRELDALGISYDSTPGVTAAFGAAASLNLEYTIPEVAQTLILTRMEGRTPVPERENIAKLATHQTSMAIYLSAGQAERLREELLAGGYGEDTPVAVAYKATWEEERIIYSTLDKFYVEMAESGIANHAVILVGEVIGDAAKASFHHRSKLYDPDFSTGFRQGNGGKRGVVGSVCGEGAIDRRERSKFEGRKYERRKCEGEKLNINIISFTDTGDALAEKIVGKLGKENENITLFPVSKRRKQCFVGGLEKNGAVCRTENEESVENNSGVGVENGRKRGGVADDDMCVALSAGEIVKLSFDNQVPLLFIGAMGICVRLIAPYIRDKMQDIPVLVMDEAAKHIIPVLSGHIGGANRLAEDIAKRIGAQAVLTTATDVRGVFAVDAWAAEQGLSILNRDGIQKVSAKLLAGETVTVAVQDDRYIIGENGLPDGVVVVPWEQMCTNHSYGGKKAADEMQVEEETQAGVDVCVAERNADGIGQPLLRVVPKRFVIGMGCKRGTSAERLEWFARELVLGSGIGWDDIAAVATIDRKAEEEGLVAFCRKNRLPLVAYSAERLAGVAGDFAKSSFVKETVGVDNVCERAAAVYASERSDEWQKVIGKTAKDGMTVAVYAFGWQVLFL